MLFAKIKIYTVTVLLFVKLVLSETQACCK